MDSGSSESKSEHGTFDPDSKYPLKVLYCGGTAPCCVLQYCEYMPEPAKCRHWLEKNFPDVFARMTVETLSSSCPVPKIRVSKRRALCRWIGFNVFLFAFCLTGPAANAPKQETGTGEAPPAGEDEEKKKQKRGGRGQIRQKKKTVPQKVTIAKIPRAKKKYVTRVCGLATFDIELKEAQRFFAQKFSCGASVTAEDEIIIQGDFTDDIIDVIQEKWPEVDDDSIDDLGEVKK
ncbi:Density-regulated protein [Nibea albiflora]|uniref:Density-regulated protein n=1 Tax=Nibea albiflora TaxID=240163 RepID=A0ACB7F990_NIBAL|nr:Density-regulated protein [Nibea albiflora]